MRRILLAVAFVAASSPLAAAEFPVVSATGRLVDLLCYAQTLSAAGGNPAAADADACFRTSGRDPIGLLDGDVTGKLWTVAAPPKRWTP